MLLLIPALFIGFFLYGASVIILSEGVSQLLLSISFDRFVGVAQLVIAVGAVASILFGMSQRAYSRAQLDIVAKQYGTSLQTLREDAFHRTRAVMPIVKSRTEMDFSEDNFLNRPCVRLFVENLGLGPAFILDEQFLRNGEVLHSNPYIALNMVRAIATNRPPPAACRHIHTTADEGATYRNALPVSKRHIVTTISFQSDLEMTDGLERLAGFV